MKEKKVKQKATRNKTINISVKEGKQYLERCITVDNAVSDINSVTDKIIHGDTFKVLEFLPKNSVDLIVVDPPYNLTKNYNGRIFSKKSQQEYVEYTKGWLEKVEPLLKENGSIYVCCDWQSSLVIGQVLSEFFEIQNRITWQREKGRGAKGNWKNGMEDIWFATKGSKFNFNLQAVKVTKQVIAPYRENGKPKDWYEVEGKKVRSTCPSNFWDDITIPFWSMKENTSHPTQKPEKLLAKLILASSNEGDIVLDPFNGSGSTSVTAKKLNRKFIGIEIEDRFCIWAQKRLEMADSDKSIQGYENGVFLDRNSKL